LGSIGMPRAAQYSNGTWTLLERDLTSGRAFLTYFQLLLAPIDIAGSYDFNSIPLANVWAWDAWLALLLIAATMVFAFRNAKSRPAISFGILFFYAAMLPMSNWIVPGGVLVAERYLYVPSFGLAMIAGTLWTAIPAPGLRRIAAAGLMATAVLLCISHNYVWKNELTYFGNMVRVLPNNSRGRQGYGIALLRVDRADEARAQFEAGLRILRTTPLLLGMAGQVIRAEGSCRNAHPLIDEALNLQPKDYFARWLLAECYEREGQLVRAEQTYRKAIEDAPFPDPQLLLDWGVTLERIGHRSDALEAYRRAALIDPDNVTIQRKLSPAILE
jgi:protein O-mannosyl-transferase